MSNAQFVKKIIGGKEIIIETGKLAKQADGAVTVRIGDTIVLVTACCAKKAREGIDFFPLVCDYQEKTYSAGQIPGGYFKREGRPTEKEILTSRIMDRPIRPLFPEGMKHEVQLVATVISTDAENNSDIPAMIGTSAALAISDIPFNGPIASVRVGRVDGSFILNPTFDDLEKSDLDLLLSGSRENVVMIEAGCHELTEETLLDAIDFGHGYIKEIVDLEEELVKLCGKSKREIEIHKVDEELSNKVREKAFPKFEEANKITVKEDRQDAIDSFCEELIGEFAPEDGEVSQADVKSVLKKAEEDSVRKCIVVDKKRVDGRDLETIRPISSEVNLLPRAHGSALFTRGQTQSLSAVTLGSQRDEQFIDALEGEKHKGFMLHYNFPPFSVGEVRPMRGPGRREVGHGALAERALSAVIPSKEDFPYTIRIVSEILESNGSSSMATVCGGTLALMDAGAPIKAPVSGIAMGLITDGDDYSILTDIAGVEDHFGDMDFKVAGTKDGITAIQLDIKIQGLTREILTKALDQAKRARLSILDKMLESIAEPKKDLSPYAPKIISLKVPVDKIGEVIGPGGKNIKRLIEESKAQIDISDDGTVQIAGTKESNVQLAIDRIEGVAAEPVIGQIYSCEVKKIMPFGAFCEYLPGRDGLIHVSELSNKYVKNPEDEVKVGDKFDAKLIEIDKQGRIKLSRKQAIDNPSESEEINQA